MNITDTYYDDWKLHKRYMIHATELCWFDRHLLSIYAWDASICISPIRSPSYISATSSAQVNIPDH